MFNQPIKTCIALCALVFCSASRADISININGQEVYSNANGYTKFHPENVSGNVVVNVNGETYRPQARRTEKPAAKFKTVNPVPSRTVRVSRSKNKQQFEQLIAKTADKHQVDPKLLHAVIQAESAYNPSAVSSAGAVGLMQLMPATAARFGVTDSYDPVQNIEGGTRYLKHLLHLFNSDLRLAVAAYNAGENAVIRHHHNIPPYAETQHYVSEVLALHENPDQIRSYFRKRSSGCSGRVLEWNVTCN
ncbi:lytic transglycosylase domain-containing protein [Methylomicrobium lacus]|uniref:lytic transglycosylase domain-containing protein n=1 Tax=Methylomicrobium lacus TaxID=136992 RepID=UPI0035A82F78